MRSDLPSWGLRRVNACGPRPARAPHGAGLRACAAHRGTPILGHAGLTLWFPQALGAGVAAPEPPGVKKKLLEFQERERTESGDWGSVGVGGERRRPLAPLASDAAPSMQCPGLARRLRGRATHGWAREAGNSTVDPCRHLDSRALNDTDTNTPAGHKRPPPHAALQRQLRTVLPSETGIWDSLPKDYSIFTTSRVASPPSHGLTCLTSAQTPNPLERRCVLTPIHTHTDKQQPKIHTSLFSKLSLVKLQSHQVYQPKESRDKIKTQEKNAYEKILKLTPESSRYLCGVEERQRGG